MDFHKLDTEKEVFFYEQDFYVLSNFSSFAVDYREKRFPTAEHLYHWLKFDTRYGSELDVDFIIINTRPSIQQAIIESKSAHAAFKFAQSQKYFYRTNWDAFKIDEMRMILRLKVEQHEYVRTKLLKTGNRMLIEDSWRDNFWGWGPNKDGQNQLGKLWMQVRDETLAKEKNGK